MNYQEKKDKITELGKMIALSGRLVFSKRSKISELQDKLEFRLRELEEEGMDEKISTMEKVLEIIHAK
jgi:hypothetical protein